jgi:hypothetical protein
MGSIGIQHFAGGQYYWKWAIDTVIPVRTHQTQSRGTGRVDCTRLFKAAWERFGADDANLTMFPRSEGRLGQAAPT